MGAGEEGGFMNWEEFLDWIWINLEWFLEMLNMSILLNKGF